MKYLLMVLLLVACQPPIIDDVFKTGKEVPPPWGCEELRTRGGEC